MERDFRTVVINGRFLEQDITGVQRYAHEILKAIDRLAANRKDVRFQLAAPRRTAFEPALKHISICRIGVMSGHAWEQVELPAFCFGKVLFCPANTAPLACLILRVPTVVCVHDLSYRYFPGAYRLLFRLFYSLLIPIILRMATSVITVSNSEKEAIVSVYPFAYRRLHVIQNGGLPDDASPPATGIVRDARTVLYVGSLSKRKNFDNMIIVAKRLSRQRGIRFIFVGGIASSLQGVIDISESRGDIVLTGQINDIGRMLSIYQSATIMMFPSYYEASPLPPVEAMGCGCPVLASRIPSLIERCGDAALYCDPADVDDICSKVIQLIDDSNLRLALYEKGLERAKQFTWEKSANKLLDLLSVLV